MSLETSTASKESLLSPEKLKKQQIIYRLQNQIFSHDPTEFKVSLNRSHHLPMLTDYSLDELATINLFKVQDYSVGFGLKQAGELTEIVAVHNNEFSVHNLGSHIVQAAITLGGNALDHFGSNKLNQLYESMGFVEVYREPYNPIYDPDQSFISRYGPLPVIYRILQK